ncbi:MAG: hypothetical protein KAH18_00175 [Psychromonas sp.]|nr:hypothetical protein [Psychromonas sp.]
MRASWACDYVQNTVRLRTMNQSEGINKTADEYDYLLTRLNLEREISFVNYFRDGGVNLSVLNNLYLTCEELKYNTDYVALYASLTKVGCCQEATALAFTYLKRMDEYGMAVVSFIGIDHCFIVMGLQTPLSLESYGQMNLGVPNTWGRNVIICDPWYYEWFLADVDWMRKIRQIVRYATRKLDESTGEINELDMRDNADLSFRLEYCV